MMNQNALGIKFDAVYDGDGPIGKLPHRLGTVLFQNEKGYMLVKAGEDIADQNFVVIDPETYVALELDRAAAEGAAGHLVGLAQAALDYTDASNTEYGWVLVYGEETGAAGTSCAAHVTLYTTDTAGKLDDASSEQFLVYGVHATAAETGGAGTTTFFLNYPYLAAAVPALIDPTEVHADASEYDVLTTRWVGNKQYQFVKANGVELTATNWVTFDPTSGEAIKVVDEAASAVNDLVGVAETTIASGSYGWVTVNGMVEEADVAGGFVAGVATLYGGGTDGQVDDADGGGDACTILGAVSLSGVDDPSAGHASFLLNNPRVTAAGG